MNSNQDIEAPEISVKTIPTVIIRPSIRHAGDVSNKVANLERREAVINTKRAWRDVAACAGVFLVIILLIGVIVVNVLILCEVSEENELVMNNSSIEILSLSSKVDELVQTLNSLNLSQSNSFKPPTLQLQVEENSGKLNRGSEEEKGDAWLSEDSLDSDYLHAW